MKALAGNVPCCVAYQSDRLTRLTIRSREKNSAVEDEELEEAFDDACRNIWPGYTLDNVDEDLLPANDHKWLETLTGAEGQSYALSRGYDLRVNPQHSEILIEQWFGFNWMILAEERGLLTPEHKAAYALKCDAENFLETKQSGVISGR